MLKKIGFGIILIIITMCKFIGNNFAETVIELKITRTATPIKNYPGNVSVIRKDEIEKVAPGNISELLTKAVPDINIQESQFCQTRTRQITLRGVPDQGKTLSLLDGIPIHSPWHGWLDWNLKILIFRR